MDINSMTQKIESTGIRGVIFDVDGTLYSLSKMHMFIGISLTVYYLFHPWRLREILIIYNFRKMREQLAGREDIDVSVEQYSAVAKKMDVSSEQVKSVIDYWMLKVPLHFIRFCAYELVIEFISELENRGIKQIYYSDYPARDKVRSLGLKADYCFDSSGQDINSLKPSLKGLEYIVSTLGIDKSHLLYIGDSPRKDGTAARSYNIKYWKIEKLLKND